MHDEEHLLERLFDRQPGAADEFVRMYARLFAGVVRGFRLAPDHVDDVTQAIFEKLWEDDFRRLKLWNGAGSLGAYLRQVGRNAARDWLREQRVNVPLPGGDDDEPLPEEADPGIGPEGAYALAELRSVLESALSELPDGCQQRIQLKFILDLDYEEIAQRLETTVNSVRARISQCLKHLRGLLQTGWQLGELPL
jgi:RNA polymerase sigma-70 factor (ECF subfamily)